MKEASPRTSGVVKTSHCQSDPAHMMLCRCRCSCTAKIILLQPQAGTVGDDLDILHRLVPTREHIDVYGDHAKVSRRWVHARTYVVNVVLVVLLTCTYSTLSSNSPVTVQLDVQVAALRSPASISGCWRRNRMRSSRNSWLALNDESVHPATPTYTPDWM